MRGLKLHWQILIALSLALLCGSWSGKEGALFGLRFYDVYVFVGTIFLNALKMVVVPLIVAAIITGLMNLGSHGALGRMGVRIFAYYLFSSTCAILIGLSVVNLLQPGIIDGEPAKEKLSLSAETSGLADKLQNKNATDVLGALQQIVPSNVVSAAVNGEMLSLIFFSLLFGYFLSKLSGAPGDTVRAFWQGVFDVMMKITEFIMRFSPVGVFALVAKVVAATGLSVLVPLAMFFAAVVLGLCLHMFVVLPSVLRIVARVSPVEVFRAMSPALLMAFSTSSSSATLPLTMGCVENRVGVSKRVTSFSLPMGTTVNMDGTALYECAAAMFIAQAYGIDLSFGVQFTIVTLALLTSIGMAGIPSASLVAIVVILAGIGLPAEGIGLILAVDRLLDMFRTSVNVFSDSVSAIVVARLEGEQLKV